jgi:hypothetical protein
MGTGSRQIASPWLCFYLFLDIKRRSKYLLFSLTFLLGKVRIFINTYAGW